MAAARALIEAQESWEAPMMAEALSVAMAALSLSDELRRTHGRFVQAWGWAPAEAPWREVVGLPGFRLRQYGDASGPPALIVTAPIKRPYIWDMRPGISVVRQLMTAGFAVHLAEWLPTAGSEFDLNHCVGRCLGDALDAAAGRGRSPVVVFGHSLGGTLATMAACLRPEAVGALVVLEAPLHFGADAGVLATAARLVDLSGLAAGHAGSVPGSLLDLLAVTVAPEAFVGWRVADFVLSFADPQALQLHALVERWTLDEFAMPAPLFRDVMTQLYRDDLFLRGLLSVGGRRLGPARLSAPVLAVIDPASAVAPRAAIQPFLEASAAETDVLLWSAEHGCALPHVATLIGHDAHRRLWPLIIAWVKQCRA